MKRPQFIAGLVAAVLVLWGGYRVYIAYADLVTLDVRNMDVRRVAKKIEWQTWETILLNTNVGGTVTLNVRRVPLPEVLNIIALQTSCRWTALYPIYRMKPSAEKFERVVRGEIPAAGSGWENLDKVANFQKGAGTAFGSMARSANNLVSAQIENKDVQFAALALSRFSQAQVVPEDSATGNVNLKLDQAPFAKAVKQVATQVHRKWDKLYALHPARGISVARKVDVVTGTNAPAPGTPVVMEIRTNVSPPAPRQRDPAEQARQMEALFATMTPEERQKAEQQITTMQEIQALPEADRQARMQEMAAQAKQASQANLDQRIRKRLRDGTTDQRIAHDRELLKRKQQQQTPRQ